MSEKKHSSNDTSGRESDKVKSFVVPEDGAEQEMTLADLPVGTEATIIKIMPKARGRKKFADVGLVVGSELLIESHAPFGGLIRVKVMETSMALHRDDAANIVIKQKKAGAKK